MTPFEYVLAFVSIVVGLAVADLATSLHRLLRAGRRLEWDWLAPLSALLALLSVLEFWWSFYRVGQESAWSVYGHFLPLLALVVVLVLLAAAALPDEVPPEGLRLRDYYDGNARYFWTLFTIFLALASLVSVLPAIGRVPPARLAAGQGGNVVVGAIAASLAVVPRRAYHRVVLPLLLLFLGVFWSRMRLEAPRQAPASVRSSEAPRLTSPSLRLLGPVGAARR